MEVEAEAVAYLCADALELGGADEARGYIQHYLARGGKLDEPTCRRIFSGARTLWPAPTRHAPILLPATMRSKGVAPTVASHATGRSEVR